MKRYALIMGGWGIFAAIFFCSGLTVQVYALEESTQQEGSNAVAVHNLGETGQGVNVGVILARNVRTTHVAFLDDSNVSHAFNYDFSGDGISISSHDTQLAGIISSRGGALFPNDIGVAPGADIYCARVADNNSSISWTEFNNALSDLISNHGCRVMVTGFELVGIPADGQSAWTIMYDYYAYEYGVIFANAAGNENTYVAVEHVPGPCRRIVGSSPRITVPRRHDLKSSVPTIDFASTPPSSPLPSSIGPGVASGDAECWRECNMPGEPPR